VWGLWVLDDTFPRSLGGSNEIDLASLRALGSWGFISLLFGSVGSSLLANSVSWIHCVNSPTNLVGVRQIWSESDKFGRSPTNLVGVRRIWSESDEFGRSPTNLVGVRRIWSESDKFGRSPTNLVGVRRIWSESDKFGRSPTKPRDWLALAAADVLSQGRYRERYWG
jgi:hypothetical protein